MSQEINQDKPMKFLTALIFNRTTYIKSIDYIYIDQLMVPDQNRNVNIT